MLCCLFSKEFNPKPVVGNKCMGIYITATLSTGWTLMCCLWGRLNVKWRNTQMSCISAMRRWIRYGSLFFGLDLMIFYFTKENRYRLIEMVERKRAKGQYDAKAAFVWLLWRFIAVVKLTTHPNLTRPNQTNGKCHFMAFTICLVLRFLKPCTICRHKIDPGVQ